MTTEFRTYLIVFIMAILTPYATIIFFIRTGSFLTILLVLFFALVVLILSTIIIVKIEPNKSRKKYYWIIATLAIISFVFSYSLQVTIADWIFFKSREDKLSTFVYELKKYGKITQMSDGQRQWKSVNFTSVELNIAKVDTTSSFDKKYFLDDILKRDGIDREHYEFFRTILTETSMISFTILKDETISFTIDGFLDNCYGIAYSETGEQPSDNDCGHIIKWKRIGNNWYSWSTT